MQDSGVGHKEKAKRRRSRWWLEIWSTNSKVTGLDFQY